MGHEGTLECFPVGEIGVDIAEKQMASHQMTFVRPFALGKDRFCRLWKGRPEMFYQVRWSFQYFQVTATTDVRTFRACFWRHRLQCISALLTTAFWCL